MLRHVGLPYYKLPIYSHPLHPHLGIKAEQCTTRLLIRILDREQETSICTRAKYKSTTITFGDLHTKEDHEGGYWTGRGRTGDCREPAMAPHRLRRFE